MSTHTAADRPAPPPPAASHTHADSSGTSGRPLTQPAQAVPGSDRSYVLTLGFGTSVAMWFVGYLCRIPPVWVPSWLLLCLLMACLAGGGFLAGRWTGRGWRAGLEVGVLSSVLNMLILGSLLSGGRANQVIPSALWWIPGSVVAGALLGSIGAAAGAALARVSPVPRPLDWTAGFAAVAAAATLLLLIVGGVVTSEGAGLSVVDWPTSFGYNMFLYPLSRMTGGVYFEHAHRLFGSLVGLTTLVLALHLIRVERRPWVKWYALAALGLVIVQGLLGGLRVTGHFTSSMSPADTSPSILLAIVHGVTGQLFFAALVALTAFTSWTWRSDRAATMTSGAGTDRSLSALLVSALVVQLLLGAVLRHVSRGLMVHLTMATLVTILGVAAGARAAALDRGQPILKRLGTALLILLAVQISLGVSALAVRSMVANTAVDAGVIGGAATGGLAATSPPVYAVVLRTAHQASGAILLATAVLLLVWNWRLLEPSTGHDSRPDPA